MNHYCCSELLYGTIGTDSMAELKEEGSHTAATATQLPTAATGDRYRTLSELHHNDRESAPVIMYSLQLLMTCVMCWRLWMISMTG